MVDSSENNFSYVPFNWHMVAQNINEFIIPECQEACISLWARNIGTFMCSNREELSDISYILLNDLSEENKHIIDELIKKGTPGYSYDSWRRHYRLSVKGGSKEQISEALFNLTKAFEMQDVLEGYYKSVDEAIAVQNNYYKLDKDSIIYLDTDRVEAKRDIGIEFNTDDFLVCEDGRVWKDKFYEDRHKKYLDYKDAIGKLAKREAENKKGEIISLYIEELKKELAEGGKYYTGFVPYKQLSSNDEIMALSEKHPNDDAYDTSELESVIDIKYGEFTISIIDGSQIMVTNSEGVIYQGKGAEEIVNKYLEDENIEFDLSTRFIILKILNGNTEIENENPEDTRYNYQYVPWHIVEENPDEYSIPECQNACKALWNNNIGTFMCSNLNELDGTKYVDINSLSKKNIELIEQLIKDGVPGYSYDSYRNAYRIYANGEGEEVRIDPGQMNI